MCYSINFSYFYKSALVNDFQRPASCLTSLRQPEPGARKVPEKSRMSRTKRTRRWKRSMKTRQRKSFQRTKNTYRRFKKTKTNIFGMSVTDFQEQPLKTLPDGCDTPYDFKLLVPDKFVDQTVETSQLYAARMANSHILPKLTHNNIRISHAIMYMTGYLTPSNMRMYWEKREDSRNNMVARTMSEATFTNIIRNTTFVKTTVADPKDRFLGVRAVWTPSWIPGLLRQLLHQHGPVGSHGGQAAGGHWYHAPEQDEGGDQELREWAIASHVPLWWSGRTTSLCTWPATVTVWSPWAPANGTARRRRSMWQSPSQHDSEIQQAHGWS
jgi:hypothetical protein